MSAKHAILGLLLNKPSYAYELSMRLPSRLGPAWTVNSGQISKTLERLELEGFVEVIAEPAGVGGRRVVGITALGVEESDRWFADDTAGPRLSRRPLVVKIILAGPDRLPDALTHIDKYEVECVQTLNKVTKNRSAVPSDEGDPVRADYVLLLLAISGEVEEVEGQLKWARHARSVVRSLMERDAVWPSEGERSRRTTATDDERNQARARLFSRTVEPHVQPVAGSGETR
jgi:DNA-binding PadR family transcriptional regulator